MNIKQVVTNGIGNAIWRTIDDAVSRGVYGITIDADRYLIASISRDIDAVARDIVGAPSDDAAWRNHGY